MKCLWTGESAGKEFGIGMTKTGTRSLCRALTALGYRASHYPSSLDMIHRHDASADITVSYRYKFLDQMYPDSRFVLTTRSYEDWIATVPTETRDPRKCSHWQMEARVTLYGAVSFDPAVWTEAWHRHHREVAEYFSGRDSLLVLRLEEEDKWGKLCPFLGKDVPTEPYPHLGKNRRLAGF